MLFLPIGFGILIFFFFLHLLLLLYLVCFTCFFCRPFLFDVSNISTTSILYLISGGPPWIFLFPFLFFLALFLSFLLFWYIEVRYFLAQHVVGSILAEPLHQRLFIWGTLRPHIGSSLHWRHLALRHSYLALVLYLEGTHSFFTTSIILLLFLFFFRNESFVIMVRTRHICKRRSEITTFRLSPGSHQSLHVSWFLLLFSFFLVPFFPSFRSFRSFLTYFIFFSWPELYIVLISIVRITSYNSAVYPYPDYSLVFLPPFYVCFYFSNTSLCFRLPRSSSLESHLFSSFLLWYQYMEVQIWMMRSTTNWSSCASLQCSSKPSPFWLWKFTTKEGSKSQSSILVLTCFWNIVSFC